MGSMKLFLLALLLPLTSVAGNTLYVGDSHSYLATMSPGPGARRLGHLLIEGLKARGDSVSYYAACGSDPQSWATGGNTPCGYSTYVDGSFTSAPNGDFPSIATLYSPTKFSALIVNLGDNMFSWKKVNFKLEASYADDSFQLRMRNFFAKLGTPVNCTWIGPTYHVEGEAYRKPNAAVDELYKALGAFLAGKCKLIDSRPLVVTSTPNDGLHHVAADSAKWGQGILDKLK